MEAAQSVLVSGLAPQVKVETSPTGSLLSDPSGVYPSLFSGSTVASSAAATPADTGCDGFDFVSHSAEIEFALEAGVLSSNKEDAAADASSDKKPAKKRKSWGQVLPEPKTNLPPRKRAKTEDEKEQRRVERVLRNRRAAQSSRERKRLEVEALEIRNRELEEQLAKVRRENAMLYERLTQVQGKPVVVSTANAPVTLSQELFSSQSSHSFATGPSTALGSFLGQTTIDPVSLSPDLHPIPDTSDIVSTLGDQDKINEPTNGLENQTKTGQPNENQGHALLSEPSATTGVGSSVPAKLEPSPDTTHRPAATLCPDLQCLSAEVSPVWTVPETSTPVTASSFFQKTFLLLMLSRTVISAFSRPVMQIALLLRAGISIPPTPAILTSIIWLTTTPSLRSMARNSTLTTSSIPMGRPNNPAAISSLATATSALSGRPSSTLRLKLLRKILTSNPMLARPIRDATMRVLRSVCSEERLGSVSGGEQARLDRVQATRWSETGIDSDGSWLNKSTRPSKEALVTLLWALRIEERRLSLPTGIKPPLSPAHARSSFPGKSTTEGLHNLSMKRR